MWTQKLCDLYLNLNWSVKMNNNKTYTLELKQEAIKLVTEKGYSMTEAETNLGIGRGNITRWIKESQNGSRKTAKSSDESQEIKRLRKENQRLKLEREILKKAAAFFAKESR